MGSFGCIKSLSDLPSEKTLIGYVKKAAALNEAGIKAPGRTQPKKKEPLAVPDYFNAALKKNAKARKTFENFPPEQETRISRMGHRSEARGDPQRTARDIDQVARGRQTSPLEISAGKKIGARFAQVTGLSATWRTMFSFPIRRSNRPVANAVCAALEREAIRCWIAPRDVMPGRSYSGEITRAIQQSRAFVLIFSESSNNSEQVLREVQLAANSRLHIVQFRIDAVVPSDDLEYYLSGPHWLDAVTPPLENHLAQLQTSVKALLALPRAEETGKEAPARTPRTASDAAPTQALPASPSLAAAPLPTAAKSSPDIWKWVALAAVCSGSAWRRCRVLDVRSSALQARGDGGSAFRQYHTGSTIADSDTARSHLDKRRRGGTLCKSILSRDGTGRCEQGSIVPR